MSRAIAGRGKSGAAGTIRVMLRALQDYFWQSELPLTALIFLLPMIVLYEVGTHFFASDWSRHTETRVLAFNLLRQFMEIFGATGRYLPGLVVVGVLLAWHVARRDPWRLHVGTAMGMVVESAMLALPLLVLGNLVGHFLPLYAASNAWKGGIVLALGAGIYEELVFRLMAFTLLNILLIDLLRIRRNTAYVLIVVISSTLFSAYHYWSPQSGPFRWSDCVFRTASGVYFGTLFITRGFGVTAGSHAAYDIYFFLLHAFR